MKHSAQSRYQFLSSDREQFLDMGRSAARLTLPYLLTEDGLANGEALHTPWQSVGAKGVNVLSSKMMMSLFPINATFFKLQINDGELSKKGDITPEVRSEIDLSLSKMERVIMQQIGESNDRVYLHAAMKHLVVSGNALVYAGKKALKTFPLDRYVISRDGDGNVVEIITKEVVDRDLLPPEFQKASLERDSNAVGEDGPKFGMADGKSLNGVDEAVVYTCVKSSDGQHKWHQECADKIIPGSQSRSPIQSSPWMPLRSKFVDGERYGRGLV